MNKKARNYILTTFGMDGAAAAAMALLKLDNAEIIPTSAARLTSTLKELSGSLRTIFIYICGVGINENESTMELMQLLKRLRSDRSEVVWICGRGYMDEYREELEEVCKVYFDDCASNTECAKAYFNIDSSGKKTVEPANPEWMEELADEFVKGTIGEVENNLWWHDLERASASKYFKYDDLDFYKGFILKLAGKKEISATDEREIRLWRAGGSRAQPLGNSPAIKKMRNLIKRIGSVEAPVLVLGPSGSGKELTARLLHEASKRSDGPFVPVNCAILSTNSDMAHDKLFGHVAGAYTGADKSAPGAFEAADGGTLFLDEVAELPLTVQTQLLRALEEREIAPLGTMKTKQVNVRIVAATNRDLQAMIRAGEFRLDLYHRLNVLRMAVPSLAERKSDMKSIAGSILRDLNNEGYPLKISEADWKYLMSYDWPGNIREFVNILRRAAYMGISLKEALSFEDKEAVCAAEKAGGYLPQNTKEVKPEKEIRREYMQHVLGLCDNNYSKAAKLLDVSINTLRAWTGIN